MISDCSLVTPKNASLHFPIGWYSTKNLQYFLSKICIASNVVYSNSRPAFPVCWHPSSPNTCYS